MNRVPRISTGAIFVIAFGATLGSAVADLSAEPLSDSGQTISIGIPPQDAGTAGQRPVELENPRDEGLVLEYNLRQFSLQGGKINPAVGISWDPQRSAPSPTDRKQAGNIALSAGVKFAPEKLGRHRLSGGASFLDLSSFQNQQSKGTDPYEDFAGAAPSNRIDAPAFNVMLEGGQFPIAPDLSYRLGYIQRTKGLGPAKDESGFTAGLSNRFDFSTGIALTPSVEAARLSDGTSTDRDYFSASMLTEWRNWNLSLTYGRRDGDGSAASLMDSYEAGASIGYVFDSGITADLGWERQREAEEIADHIGFQFKYRFGLGR